MVNHSMAWLKVAGFNHLLPLITWAMAYKAGEGLGISSLMAKTWRLPLCLHW